MINRICNSYNIKAWWMQEENQIEVPVKLETRWAKGFWGMNYARVISIPS